MNLSKSRDTARRDFGILKRMYEKTFYSFRVLLAQPFFPLDVIAVCADDDIYVLLVDWKYLLVFTMPGCILMFLSFSIKGIVSRRVLIWIKVDIRIDTLLDILICYDQCHPG